jgi:hypothetical protein
LKKYNLVATINAISSCVLNNIPRISDEWGECMSTEQLIECQNYGIEIASHSSMHDNNVNSIVRSIDELAGIGVNVSSIGFASPFSSVTENDIEILDLIDKGVLLYIRSGVQVKREGIIYSVLTYIQRKFHSKKLFWKLNSQCLINKDFINNNRRLLMSVAITSDNTLEQLQYFLNNMKHDETVIFNFHSILPDDNKTVTNKWRWSDKKFESFCKVISDGNMYRVITTKDIFA